MLKLYPSKHSYVLSVVERSIYLVFIYKVLMQSIFIRRICVVLNVFALDRDVRCCVFCVDVFCV